MRDEERYSQHREASKEEVLVNSVLHVYVGTRIWKLWLASKSHSLWQRQRISYNYNQHLSQFQCLGPKPIVPHGSRNRIQQARVDDSILEDSTHKAMVVVSKQALMLAFWKTTHTRR